MSAMTDFAENQLIDFMFRGAALSAPFTWYFALFTTAPTDAGGGVEVSGGSYARVAYAQGASQFSATDSPSSSVFGSNGTSGTTYNLQDIQFPVPTANWGTVVALGMYSAVTGGDLWFYGPISPSKVVNSGDLPPKFSVGQFAIALA